MNNYGFINRAQLHHYAVTDDIIPLATTATQITAGGTYIISQSAGTIFLRITSTEDNSTVMTNLNSISLSDDAYIVLYIKAGQWIRVNDAKGTCVRLEPV